MQVPVSEAKALVAELVWRAEAGEEIVLTRHGQAAVRLVPVHARPGAEARAQLLDELVAQARRRVAAGDAAARSQDFLYGSDGLPS